MTATPGRGGRGVSGCVVRVGMLSPGETQPGLSLLPGGQAGSGGIFPAPALPAAAQTNQVIGNMEIFCAH